jgi:hypothetical protein
MSYQQTLPAWTISVARSRPPTVYAAGHGLGGVARGGGVSLALDVEPPAPR